MTNTTCKTKNAGIERNGEGLILHHIAEECCALKTMTAPEYAKRKPYDLYSAKHFVYCNYLEHFLLHIKIAQEDARITHDVVSGVDMAGVRAINRELNRYYAIGKIILPNKSAAELVRDDYEKYLEILRYLLLDQLMSKYCTVENLSLDANGVVMQKIFHDLSEN